MYQGKFEDVSVLEFVKAAIQKDEYGYFVDPELEDDMEEEEKTTIIKYHCCADYSPLAVRFDINQICTDLMEAKEDIIKQLFNFD